MDLHVEWRVIISVQKSYQTDITSELGTIFDVVYLMMERILLIEFNDSFPVLVSVIK